MSRIAYVNGAYLPQSEARVGIEDRGYQLADGVYEVAPVVGGVIVDATEHFDRLARSLGELRIEPPMPRRSLEHVCRETLARNRVVDGSVYVQVTRGVAPRDHGFPRAAVRPAVVVTAKSVTWPLDSGDDPGIEVITTPDIRWGRCDIKSIGLLPNVLAKQKAREAGAFEAWFVRADGTISEGASTNAWMVDDAGRVITRPLGPEILAGVTRATVLRLARAAGYEVIERPFGLDELKNAREAFLTSTTSLVKSVIAVDGRPVANGYPGETGRRLRALCLDHYRGRPNP